MRQQIADRARTYSLNQIKRAALARHPLVKRWHRFWSEFWWVTDCWVSGLGTRS